MTTAATGGANSPSKEGLISISIYDSDGSQTDDYSQLFPADMSTLTSIEVLWHMTNHIIPLHEVESYSLEFSGMLGDLGLYIPIIVLLALNGQIDLGTTLITTGLCNILTGLVFKVPMCVQPMKSIATVALTEMLSEGEIMAAGLGTSIIVMFLGMTNMITVIDGLIPKPVVRGLQIGLGLSMFAKAINMLPDETKLTWDVDSWMHWDGYLVGSVALLFCVITAKSRWCPTAFIMFLVGIIIASIRMGTANEVFEFGITKIHTVVPTASDWSRGLFLGTLPQVPTTLINSCIAVCKLSETLYPDRETGLNLRSVSTSVGMMNVGFCWFGGYPMCHGSGGLAGQHRFGARTNLSIIALGFCKLVLGIFFGKGLLGILNYFPAGLLASLLAVASWELSVSGREGLKGTIEEARLCVLTAALVTFYGQAIGIVMGIILAYTIMIADTIFGTSEEVQKGKVRVEKFKKDNAIFYNQCREWWIEQYNNPSFSAMLGHTGGAPPAPTAIKKVVYKKNDGVQKVPDLNTIKNTAV